MRKILVLRGGALGDFIVTLPALARLRQRWPSAHVEFVGNAAAASLAHSLPSPPHRHLRQCHLIDDTSFSSPGEFLGNCHPIDDTWIAGRLLDAVHSQHEARWSALYGKEKLPAAFAAWLAEFDLVLNYWPDPDGELRGKFPLRTGQQFLAAAALPERAPAAAHYCSPLRALGIESTDYFFQLKGHPSCVRRAIAIHPGSGSPRKNWPRNRWLALCDWLRETFSAELLIVIGEAEADAGEEFARHGRVLKNLPLRELADELTRCRLFLGHDSGVSHLAAASGAPCLLLFGPTDPAMWAPPTPDLRVLRREAALNSISQQDVRTAVTHLLGPRS